MKTTQYLILLLAFSFQLNAQIIDKINIDGLSIIDRGTVLNYLPFEASDFYSKNRQESLEKALMNTGFFKTVAIKDIDKELNITVIENPSIKEIEIEMDSEDFVEKSKIIENLEILDIVKGKIYNKVALQKLIIQIRAIYKSGGYSKANIDYKVSVDDYNLANIKINIVENSIIKINKISITGANNFDESDLLDLLDIGEADNFIFNYFTKRDHFSRVALDAGVEKLRNFYLNNGYLDIEIDKTVVSDDKDGRAGININLKEGPLYHIKEILFTGSQGFSVEKLQELMVLSGGDIFKRSSVVGGIKKITSFFADKGYAFAEISSKIIKEGSLISLTIDINTNQKVYINRITIEGNTRTQDDVVRREIGILEGGLYSDSELNKTITKIKLLGYFEDIKMNISKAKGANDRINLHFVVTEAKTGQFSIGISHSNSTGVAFNAGIKEKNIFGTGKTLNAKLAFSKAVKNIDLFFLDPYFTNEGHSISYGIFNKSIDGSKLGSSSYITDKSGIKLGYGVPLNEDSKVNLNIRLSSIDITCSTTFASSSYEKKQCEEDYSSEIYSSVSYVTNTLNNYNFPTKGMRLKTAFGMALPLADYRYYKIDASYKQYKPLTKNITLKFNGKVGIADGYGDRDLPFFERYYGGGSSSVRGFKFNSLGSKYADGTSKGGKLSVLGGVSVISPLSWMKDSKSMRVSAFVDVGGIDSKVSSKGVDLRASAGLAFVWLTPVGPLGLYTATPLKKKDGDDVKTVDFTLGISF